MRVFSETLGSEEEPDDVIICSFIFIEWLVLFAGHIKITLNQQVGLLNEDKVF